MTLGTVWTKSPGFSFPLLKIYLSQLSLWIWYLSHKTGSAQKSETRQKKEVRMITGQDEGKAELYWPSARPLACYIAKYLRISASGKVANVRNMTYSRLIRCQGAHIDRCHWLSGLWFALFKLTHLSLFDSKAVHCASKRPPNGPGLM